MKSRFLPALVLTAAAASGQNALWIDLSGDWRMSSDDRPEYAAPDFDDHSWPILTLPRHIYLHGTQYWLRRRVDLPAGTDRGQLALTLGTLQDVYEVHVNGRRIGSSTSSFDSFSDARIPRPLTFDIPAAAAPESGALEIALRVKGILTFHPFWRLPDRGPYLLTYRAHAPIDAGRRQLESRWVTVSPHLVFGAIFFVIGFLSLVGWLGERDRRELLWFVLVCFARGFGAFYVVTRLLADTQPFTRAGVPWQFVFGELSIPFFGEFVFAALGLRSWKLRFALWTGWCLAPLAMLSSTYGSLGTVGNSAYVWVYCLCLAVIVRDWWRLTRQRAPLEWHAFRIMLFLPAITGFATWLEYVRLNLLVLSGKPAVMADVPSIELGPYWVQYDDLFWSMVSAAILAMLFLRVTADRRERQRLTGELEAARVVQQMLLNTTDEHSKEYIVDAVYRPAQEVGGDFYQAALCKDGALLVVVGDVSGKGLKAAMTVSLVTGALANRHSDQPGAVLQELNRALAGRLDGGFVTCCCARFETGGKASFANAGHLMPYLNRVEMEVPSGLPLGLMPDASFDECTAHLPPGAQVTLLSDGVVEAANVKGELFGFDRSLEIAGRSAQAIAEAAKTWGQNDDITVVTIGRSA